MDLHIWLDDFRENLENTFGQRIWFLGLQGSYGRGEATASSDIDLVVILDRVAVCDVQTYSDLLDTFSDRERLCGFFSGREELRNWDPSDLFQLYHDTTPVVGSLDELLPLIDADAVKRAIKIGACNIYHGCVHNMLFDKSQDILRGLYKSASFVAQAIGFLQTGKYVRHQAQLREILESDDRQIVDVFLNLKNGGTVEFQEMSEILFSWTRKWINQI